MFAENITWKILLTSLLVVFLLSIKESETFTAISLDDYVSDLDNADAEINWTCSGNTDLIVSISDDRIANILVPDPEWTGSELIIFTATSQLSCCIISSKTSDQCVLRWG